MNTIETLKTFDIVLHHLDSMLALDDEQLHAALQAFSEEYPQEGQEILSILKERKVLEEERVRIIRMKVDFIDEWLQKVQGQGCPDADEIDSVLKLLNIDSQQVNENAAQAMKKVMKNVS